MLIIDIGQASRLAAKLKLDIGDDILAIEDAMRGLGEKLATAINVELAYADVQDPDFGGACLSFRRCRWKDSKPRARALKALQEMDIGGEL